MSHVYQGSHQEIAQRILADGFQTTIVLASKMLDLETAGENPHDITAEVCESAVAPYLDAGLDIACLGGYCNPMHPDPSRRRRQREVFYALIRQCKSFGTRYIATETGSANPTSQWRDHPDNHTEQAWRDMVDFVAQACEVAEACGVNVLIEPYVENVLSSLEKVGRLLNEVRSPALQFVLDPNNLVQREDLQDMDGYLKRFFDLVGDRAPVAHAKDVLYDQDRISTPRAGTGKLNYPLFCRLLREYQPDAPLVLEHLKESEVESTRNFVLGHLRS